MFGRELVSISVSFCRSGAAMLSQADGCVVSVLQMCLAVCVCVWGGGQLEVALSPTSMEDGAREPFTAKIPCILDMGLSREEDFWTWSQKKISFKVRLVNLACLLGVHLFLKVAPFFQVFLSEIRFC